jgi:hypothetical protein
VTTPRWQVNRIIRPFDIVYQIKLGEEVRGSFSVEKDDEASQKLWAEVAGSILFLQEALNETNAPINREARQPSTKPD